MELIAEIVNGECDFKYDDFEGIDNEYNCEDYEYDCKNDEWDYRDNECNIITIMINAVGLP